VDTLFPPGENGRIPIVCVTGTNGKTTVTRLVAHILRAAGRVVGMTSSDGIDVSGRTIDGGTAPVRAGAQVLLNPQVEAAVFEAARGGILREGLGFDRCDVAVVTNIGQADHLGLHNVDTVTTCSRSSARRWTWFCPPAALCSMRAIRWWRRWRRCAQAR